MQPHNSASAVLNKDAPKMATSGGKPSSKTDTDGAARVEDIQADLCVIGAGSGGLSVAAAAAAFGQKVVLIEKHKMGGDCLNYGCVPSKALIAAGKRAHQMRTADMFGIASVAPMVNYRAVHDHVHSVIAAIAPNDSVERFTGLGVKVILGTGKFLDKRTVLAGEHRITARRFIIATGSSPLVPPIPGLDSVAYFTNETIFDNKDKLERLIIIGGGPIGMELAQAHHRLGSRVTVLEGMKALGKDDPELTAVVLKRLREEGVDIREGTLVERVEAGGGVVRVHVNAGGTKEVVEGTHILLAVGRKPNLADLNLEAAGIKYDKRGITVDSGLQDLEPPRVRHRRRGGRTAVHPRRQLSRRHRHPPRAVPSAGQSQHHNRAVGHLHRARAGARRSHRRAGQGAEVQDQRAALALPRERPRPGRASHRRPHQGGDRHQGHDPRRHDRRRARRRADPDMVAWRCPKA